MSEECLVNTPPTNNMGVEKVNTWNIDYLTVTSWGNNIVQVINEFLSPDFRMLEDQGHGGKFYKNTYKTDLGIIVRDVPYNNQENHSTIIIPGKACQYLGYERLSNLVQLLFRTYYKVTINRIDLAFNNCPFSVDDVLKEVIDDNLRSYFKRETIKIYSCPKQLNDLGEVGTSGITLGSRTSTRYLRIYDKHGFTRLECEYKAEKANQVGIDVLLAGDTEKAKLLAMGHLRDYIDFMADWWVEFINNFDRLYMQLPETIKEMNISQIKKWFEKQISSAFYVLGSVEGMDYLKTLYEIGGQKYNNSKYRGMVEMYIGT